jgi:hypothetical protein
MKGGFPPTMSLNRVFQDSSFTPEKDVSHVPIRLVNSQAEILSLDFFQGVIPVMHDEVPALISAIP